MTIEFRSAADDDELATALRTVESAFGAEATEADIERARKTMPHDRVVVAVDDGRLVGVAASFPYSLTVPGGELGCGGVTWVGVLPTHRRQGVASGLMRAQLGDLHERGEPLAALWASESLIYGRFGYGIAAPVYDMDALKMGFAFRGRPIHTGNDHPPGGGSRLAMAHSVNWRSVMSPRSRRSTSTLSPWAATRSST